MKALFNFNVKELNDCELEKAELLGNLKSTHEELEEAWDYIKELEDKQQELQREIEGLKPYKGKSERLREQLLLAKDKLSISSEYIDKICALVDEAVLARYNG